MGNKALAAILENSGMNGPVLDRDHSEYDKYRRVWNAVADRRPAAIVRAQNSDDVVRTIGVAAEHKVLLAVRGGGHSLPGLSTCDDGIVLDLSTMNRVSIDRATETAEVQGGALLSDLDGASVPAGLVTPAGVVSHTGVGGLTLGGGMGWLSRRFGLTIDNLLSAEIATADGRLIWADADKEPELFWGLRGGGGNFGVVTRFKFRQHRFNPIITGLWTYAPKHCEAVLKGIQHIAAAAPRELTVSCSWGLARFTLTACWSGAATEADALLVPFGKLAPSAAGGITDMNYIDLQRRHDVNIAWGLRNYAKGGFLGPIDKTAIDRMKEGAASAPTESSDVYLLQLGGAVGDIDENATAYSGRAANYYWITTAVWNDPADDQHCIDWGRKAAARMQAISLRGNYVNEQADFGKEVALSAYGAEKYARLASIKARFDPDNLFRLNQNIAPKA